MSTHTGKVIAIVAYKGGAGKTLTTVMLGWEAAGRGQRVLIIDLDPSQQSVEWLELSGMPEKRPLRATYFDAGKYDLAGFVKEVLNTGNHDLILIDTPANDRDAIAEALDVADLGIIPVNVGRSDIGMLGTTVKVYERAVRARPALKGLFLINQSGFAPSKEAWTLEECNRIETISIFKQRIPLRALYKDAHGRIPARESAYYSLYAEIDSVLTTQANGAA